MGRVFESMVRVVSGVRIAIDCHQLGTLLVLEWRETR